MLPGHPSSSTAYVVGIMVFAVLITALLIFWKKCGDSPAAPPPVATTPKSTSEPKLTPIAEYSPPPPPEVEDAGVDAGKDAAPATKPGTPEPGGIGPCTACGSGKSTPELNNKVSGRAQTARGCYARALRTGAPTGSLTLSVSVGADGRVCGASIANDTLNSPPVSSCVLSRFRGTYFSKPLVGCVVFQVPIHFKAK